MLKEEFLAILACPACHSKLVQHREWLLCQNDECRRKYPIRRDIPVMLIPEGDKYRDIAPEDLPDPNQ
ncbi:MAG: Trm112 family protein [Chloroflexi bacterium]|nr:Trm112 family protein [Chloroflexota bacterium]